MVEGCKLIYDDEQPGYFLTLTVPHGVFMSSDDPKSFTMIR